LRKSYDLMERSELIAGAIIDDEMWNFTEYSPL